MSTPIAAAEATTARPAAECRVSAAQPYVDQKGLLRAAAVRSGCDDTSVLRVRIREARRGPDRTLKSASTRLDNGTIAATLRCSDTPRSYYVLALDYRGHRAQSSVVRLACAPTGTPTTPPTNTPTTPPPTGGGDNGGGGTPGVGSAVEEEVVRLTNAARAGNGCKTALTHDAKLHAAAVAHSADMAAANYFDHTSKDGRSPGDRIKAAGFSPISAWGENIAKGQATAAAVVDAWLKSPGHRANIMNCAYTHIGVGHIAKGPLWTQVFAKH
ncbi:CAP domain-containing protein [Nonomuraea sp. NPDC050310]|uniref:CAP domain-containing protein n=1 Tax=Nonomuraea sp. NPDC050310 TaxID=3154935 RepID=UPI0033CC4030